MNKQKIVIIGATSAIAQAATRLWAKEGHDLFLIARNSEKLDALQKDLSVRGAKTIETFRYDANDFGNHPKLIGTIWARWDRVDVVLIAHGNLPDQKACEQNYALAEEEIKTNFLSIVSLTTLLANKLETQKSGTIAVISSVAGDRGRQSNYIYGCAKGGLNVYLQGLRNRLYQSNVHVLTIKPGFVDTPMTARHKKGILFASAHQIGQGIYRAIQKKKDLVYLPGFWQWIMFLIGSLPESLFKKLKF